MFFIIVNYLKISGIDCFMRYLAELKRLNLPKDKYAIFGSGCMAVRGIRKNKDLDIIVKKALYEKLIKKYNFYLEPGGRLKIGNLEIMTDYFPEIKNFNKLIDNADIINGIRYIQLKELLKWKQIKKRPKDLEDIKLIKNYLQNHKG